MSEAEVIKRCTNGPVTRQWLETDLKAIGIREGMLLMVHSSLSALGWIAGAEATVVTALRRTLGQNGTLVMPAFGGITDPANWGNPPVPSDWVEAIRENAPFTDQYTPTRHMGLIAEYFRTLPDTVRSNHPILSWAASGPLANQLMENQPIDLVAGNDNIMERCYDLDGYVLSLGTCKTTILHLADLWCSWPGQGSESTRTLVKNDEGHRQWIDFRDDSSDTEDFEEIRAAYMNSPDSIDTDWCEKDVGYGKSRLFRIQPLVDFAVEWIKANRR